MTSGQNLGIMRPMFKGFLNKMETVYSNPVSYQLKLGLDYIDLNSLIGKSISLKFENLINCLNCGKDIKKTYSGGYCFPCSITLARCDLCVLRPSLCHYHKGTCREPKWGETHCMIPHFVYLSNTSGLKVGITRTSQIPTRWIDQGAVSALPILQVSTRYQSGIFEEMISEEISDKTDWRKMLKGDISDIDLEGERDRLFEHLGSELDKIENSFEAGQVTILESETPVHIIYPVLKFPQTVKSIKFDKNPKITGTLLGIKGQYLLLDCGVLNIRNHSGYLVSLDTEK